MTHILVRIKGVGKNSSTKELHASSDLNLLYERRDSLQVASLKDFSMTEQRFAVRPI